MATVKIIELFGCKKKKKETKEIETVERIWMDVIDTEQKTNSCNVKNNMSISTKS